MPPWISIALQILGVVGVVGSLVLIWCQTRVDHKQRRRESTMSFIAAMSEYRSIDHELYPTASDSETGMSPQMIDQLLADLIDSAKAAELVAQLENFAAGVNQGVFDIDVVNAAKGGYLLSFYERWRPYMQARIRTSSYPNRLFDQIEKLVADIAKKRGKPIQAPLDRRQG
ncbi:MAG: hypothetical protein ABIJ00_12695 [Candidatus Eisenbacteria bacterium]